jgi:uncharacterized membrane protein YqjE
MGDAERSMGTVLSDIVGDLQGIVRAEVRLVRAEIKEEVANARRGTILLAGGGVVLVLSVGLILLALVYALATVWPAWAAALTVAVLAGVVGASLVMAGRKAFSAVVLPPPRTASTVRENIQWAKSRTK